MADNKASNSQARVTTVGPTALGLISQFYKQTNSANRDNPIGAHAGQGAGLPSLPKTLDMSYQDTLEEKRIMQDGFIESVFATHDNDYRALFEIDTIPLHSDTFAKSYRRIFGMDEDPHTAAVKELLTSWNPTWNPAAVELETITATTNAYGRFTQIHTLVNNVSSIDYKALYYKELVKNMSATLNNLAACRLYEGANKIFVNTLAAYDPNNPNAVRLTLGSNPQTCEASLSWDAIALAIHQMYNNTRKYTTVDPTTGKVSTANLRKTPIRTWKDSGKFLVLVSRNGYNQLISDPQFKKEVVIEDVLTQGFLKKNSITGSAHTFNVILKVVDKPLTISKEAKPKLQTTGMGALDVCFIVGGGDAMLGVELHALKGMEFTYIPAQKTTHDPRGLLTLMGWDAQVDFKIIQPEAIYAIPHTPTKASLAGLVYTPNAPGKWL